MLQSEKQKEDWMNSKWRPMMGWMYMLVCFMDFVGFPVLWSLLQAYSNGAVNSQWQPLTLQGAGLFHLAMGAVIGISAYGRTQEKLGGAAGPSLSFGPGAGTNYVPPSQPVAGNFGGSSNGFDPNSTVTSGSTPASSTTTSGGFGAPTNFSATATPPASRPSGTVTTGFGGKPAPVLPPDPVI